MNNVVRPQFLQNEEGSIELHKPDQPWQIIRWFPIVISHFHFPISHSQSLFSTFTFPFYNLLLSISHFTLVFFYFPFFFFPLSPFSFPFFCFPLSLSPFTFPSFILQTLFFPFYISSFPSYFFPLFTFPLSFLLWPSHFLDSVDPHFNLCLISNDCPTHSYCTYLCESMAWLVHKV